MKNQKYLIRCDRAGVFYAEITSRNGSTYTLANCRRVHGWDGACSLSQLAVEGCTRTDGNNRWSIVVPSMTVLGVIEEIPVLPETAKKLDAMPIWKS